MYITIIRVSSSPHNLHYATCTFIPSCLSIIIHHHITLLITIQKDINLSSMAITLWDKHYNLFIHTHVGPFNLYVCLVGIPSYTLTNFFLHPSNRWKDQNTQSHSENIFLQYILKKLFWKTHYKHYGNLILKNAFQNFWKTFFEIHLYILRRGVWEDFGKFNPKFI